MTRKDIVDCFDNIKTTEIQKQKMLNNILVSKKEESINIKQKTRFSFAAVASIAAILIFGTTTIFAMALGWHEALLSRFNPTPEQVEILSETVGYPDITVSQDGLTISVLQTITDSFGVYVLYEIIADDKTFEFPNETYINARLFTAFADYVGGVVTEGSGTSVILENEGNRLLVLQHFFSTAPATDGNVELVIWELYYISDVWSTVGDGQLLEPIFEGWWSLEWELDFESIGITLLPDTNISIVEGDVTVTQIIITPLSAMIFFEGNHFLPDPSFVNIRKNNGVEIIFGADSKNALFTRVSRDGLAGVEHDGTEGIFSQTVLYNFDSIININDIESITVGDITIFSSQD